jgi:hypothetical protein
MGCVEVQEILEPTQEQIASVKRTIAVTIIIALIAIFFMLVHFEWIHPYPNQYRIVTNGEVYKVQEKNWFYSWHIYKELDGYYGYRVRHFYSTKEAEEYMNNLKKEEARRMQGKPPDPADEWKPVN